MFRYLFWCCFLITSAVACCFKGSQEVVELDVPPQMEVHGSLVVYFKSHSTQIDIPRMTGSAMLYGSRTAITAAHNLFIKNDTVEDRKHRQEYGEYASKIIFRTYSGAEYLCMYFNIPPEYIELDPVPLYCDFAMLHLGELRTKHIMRPIKEYNFSLLNDEEISGHYISITGYKHPMVVENGERIIQHIPVTLNGDCEIYDIGTGRDPRRLVYVMKTLDGMSGSAIYYNNESDYFIVGIHSGQIFLDGKQTELNAGIRITSITHQQFLKWINIHAKQTIWRSLEILTEAIPFISLTQWRPVVLGIQGDLESKLQELFLTKLQEQLVLYSLNLVDSVDLFVASGKAGILALNYVCPDVYVNEVKVEQAVVKLSDSRKPIILVNDNVEFDSNGLNQDNDIDHIISCLSIAPSVDTGEVSACKILEIYPDIAPLVISLGVSDNSKNIHDLLIASTNEDGFIYRRIDFLTFDFETEQEYEEKINQQAYEVATILKRNNDLLVLKRGEAL